MAATMSSSSSENPLLAEWNTPYQLPPFALIKPFHYKPAILDHAFPLHLQELQQIADSIDSPTFENTIAAYDRAGSLTKKLISLFMNQCSSECPPDLQAIQLELSPLIAQHENTVATFPGLFPKISLIYQNYVQQNQEKSQILNSEQIRLIERIYLNFLRAGAQFDSNSQLKYKEIIMELATLQTQFAQNVLADESSFFLELSSSCGELDGLPDDLIASAQQAAIERNLPDGSYGITLSRSLVEPFLTYSTIREKREIAWKAWINRGQLDPSRDNASIIQRILILRNQQAIMHGYRNFAEYSTADTMAKTSDAVMELLLRVWEPAKVACNREREMLEDYIRSLPDGHRDKIPAGSAVEGWDWRYYSEKIRQVKYSFDASQLKPYFSLPQMCEALFDCAKQLFGLEFQLMENLEEDESSNGGSSSRSFSSYHRDVKTYEVYEMNPLTNQKEVRAIFIHDNYSRPNKQSGAWMSEYRVQTKNYLPCPTPAPSRSMIRSSDGSIIPIIVNNNNFSKAPEGSVTLLSYDDARTLFHEFGHGLHGILSNVTYTTLASTSVLKDFVELPSQLFEHWIAHPEVLKKYAKHYLTKENLPLELIQKVEQVQNYNNGFQTIEYLSCALFDQYLHQLVVLPTADDSTSTSTGGAATTSAVGENFDLNEIEAKYLQSIGMPTSMVLRHRPTHFLHLFSGSDYAAGYYVYLWAEVLDADGFDAFLEVGNIFDHETAQRLRKYIYSTGNSIEPGEAYRLFRGRDPTVIPMLKKKGLLEE